MTLCICGAGTMGSGIAQVSALAGFDTLLYDVSEATVRQAQERITTDWELLVQKQKITAEKKETALQKLRFLTDPSQCIADVVIEAIVEKMEVKQALFTQLAAVNSKTTIFASNTSSLSISELAHTLPHPERLAGLHFFNPATLMKLVEIVRADTTSPEVVEQLVSITEQMGKQAVVCRDSPGFIVNRVARPYYIESLRIAEEGTISMEAIDRLMENCGFRMGPFKLMDLIGNDVNYAVSQSVYEQLGKPERLKPSPLQQEKVSSGQLGKKTGQGYYTYSSNPT